MKKNLLCLVMALAMVLSLVSFEAFASEGDVYEKVYAVENYVNVVIDGEKVNTPDIVIDGTTYLGLRALAEALGYTVEWDDDSKVAILTSGGDVNLGNDKIEKGTTEELEPIYILNNYVNAIFIDGEPVMVKNIVRSGRTYLGLRDMGELLGYTVDWDDTTNTASLTTPEPTATTSVVLKGDTTSDYDDLATVFFKYYAKTYPNETVASVKEAVEFDISLSRYFKDIASKNSLSYNLGDIDAKYKEYVASYGAEETYKNTLDAFNLTEDEGYLYFLASLETSTVQPLAVNYLFNNLESIKALKDDKKDEYASVKDKLSQNVTRVKHILIPTIDLNTNQPLSEEEQKDAKKLADSILNRAKKGDFNSLVKTFNKDAGQPEEGYEVTENSQFVPEFQAAALALKKGELSTVIKTDFGYHIIKCMDKSVKTPTFDEYFASNYQQEYAALMDADHAEWAKANPLTFTVTETK